MQLIPKHYKRSLSISLLLILTSLCFAVQSYAAPPKERLKYEFKALGVIPMSGIEPPVDGPLPNLAGKMTRLSDYKGKIVFLNFMTTWCRDCILEIPDIQELHEKLGAKGLAVVAIDLDEPKPTVERFADRFGLTFDILLDKTGSMGRSFGIRAIPTTFILDRQGNLLGKIIGAREWNSKQSMSLFKFLLDDYQVKNNS